MLECEEIINSFKELKKKISHISDPSEKNRIALRELNRYSLDEWYEVGNILSSANLI